LGVEGSSRVTNLPSRATNLSARAAAGTRLAEPLEVFRSLGSERCHELDAFHCTAPRSELRRNIVRSKPRLSRGKPRRQLRRSLADAVLKKTK